MSNFKEEVIEYNREIDPSWRLCRLLNFEFNKISYFKKCQKQLFLINRFFDFYLLLSSAILFIAYFKTFNWFYEMFSFNEIIKDIQYGGFIIYLALVFIRYEDFGKKSRIKKLKLKTKRCKQILEYFEMYYDDDTYNVFKDHVDISKIRNNRKIHFQSFNDFLKLK